MENAEAGGTSRFGSNHNVGTLNAAASMAKKVANRLAERNADILRRAQAWENLHSIADSYGISRERARQILAVQGYSRAESRKQRTHRCLELLAEGLTVSEIAEVVSWNPSSIRSMMRALGVSAARETCLDCGCDIRSRGPSRKRCESCSRAHTNARRNWRYHNDPDFRALFDKSKRKYARKKRSMR